MAWVGIWIICGLLGGYAAAQVKDQPLIVFAPVGAIMGPLSLLMLAVNPAERCAECRKPLARGATRCAGCGAMAQQQD